MGLWEGGKNGWIYLAATTTCNGRKGETGSACHPGNSENESRLEAVPLASMHPFQRCASAGLLETNLGGLAFGRAFILSPRPQASAASKRMPWISMLPKTDDAADIPLSGI